MVRENCESAFNKAMKCYPYGQDGHDDLSPSPKRLVRILLRKVGLEIGNIGNPLGRLGICRSSLPHSMPDRMIRRGEPVWVDIRRVITPFGFSLADDGWQAQWSVLSAHLEGRSDDYCLRLLASFFEEFRPKSVGEALFGHADRSPHPLGRIPPEATPLIWTLPRRLAAHSGDLIPPTRGDGFNYGPISEAKLISEHRRLLRLTSSIQKHGYRPLDHGRGLIEGYFLASPNDYRFVPTEGRHRIVVLRALGYESIPVIPRFGLATIHSSDLRRWTSGSRRIYSPAALELLFSRFFRTEHPLQGSLMW
jgi:hypothetical protein